MAYSDSDGPHANAGVHTKSTPMYDMVRAVTIATVLILVLPGLVWYSDQLRAHWGFFCSAKDADICIGVFVLGAPIGIGVFNLSVVGFGLLNVCAVAVGVHNLFAFTGFAVVNDFVLSGGGFHSGIGLSHNFDGILHRLVNAGRKQAH